jgi:hypothetical protein
MSSNPINIKALAERIRSRTAELDAEGGGWAPAAFDQALKNCGNGAGGFQPGNSCGRGGDGGEAKEGGESKYGLVLDNKTAVNSENLARALESSGVKLGQVDDGIVHVGDGLHVEVTDNTYQLVSGTNATNFEFVGKPVSSLSAAVSAVQTHTGDTPLGGNQTRHEVGGNKYTISKVTTGFGTGYYTSHRGKVIDGEGREHASPKHGLQLHRTQAGRRQACRAFLREVLGRIGL